jgi:aspartate racemase
MKYLSKNQKYVAGIYGGVGPLSHIYFEQQLLKASHEKGAKSDQDHPVWILINASSTPDRTRHLLYEGESPIKHLIYFAKLLEKSGADFIVLVCNTAHSYYNEIQKKLKIPLLHMIDIVVAYIKENYPYINKVGIIGTDGTIKMGLYNHALSYYGMTPIYPKIGSSLQKKIMEAIYDSKYGIKATGSIISSFAHEKISEAVEELKNMGAEVIISACTEVSLCLNNKFLSDVSVIDPLSVIAKIVINLSYGNEDFKKYTKNKFFSYSFQSLTADLSK